MPLRVHRKPLFAESFPTVLERSTLQPGRCYIWQIRFPGVELDYPTGRFCLEDAPDSSLPGPTEPALRGPHAAEGGSGVGLRPAPFPAKGGVHLKGSLSARLGFYDVDGIPPRYENWTASLSGSLVLQTGSWNIPLRLLLGNEGRRFGQSFQKVGLSPAWKWGRFHLGHTNLRWSPFTLGGRTFLGGGVELNPGKFRFGAVYGQFQNALEEFQDTLINRPPVIAYQRSGYAFRVGVGTATNYVDLILFKARDDSTSVQVRPLPAFATPQENLVVGLSARQKLGKTIRLQLDFAVSAFTRDLRSEEDELEDSFWSDLLRPFFTPRFASQYHIAGEGEIAYRRKTFGLSARYTRIDTDYRSMGTYFLFNDVERFTLNPDFRTADNRLSFQASFGWQRNNLAEVRANDTFRRIAMLGLRFAPNRNTAFTANVSNFSLEQKPVRPLTPDTLLLDQATTTLSVGFRKNIQQPSHTQNLVLTLNLRRLADRNENTDRGYFSRGFNLFYTFRLESSRTSFHAGFLLDRFDFLGEEFLRLRPAPGIQQDALEGRASIAFHFPLTWTFKNGALDHRLLLPRLTLTLRSGKRHRLNLHFQRIVSKPQLQSTARDFREWRGTLTWTAIF
ncbi:MAG: hypothetical protein D6765_03810 [Bacteroidetes bacterium]|nr:MAG: hypothetical protein D6765_03810 [Bacteroidota bacterium]